MSGAPNHRPDRPLENYPAADLPPLPPEAAPGEGVAAVPAEPAPRKAPEVALLRFLDPAALTSDVTLLFPFAWEGREIHNITLRRLSTAEVGAVMVRIPEGEPYDLYDFISAMSGLPTPVLRGLIDDDGAEVIDKARPLLPRAVARIFFPPTSEAGVATPPPPPER